MKNSIRYVLALTLLFSMTMRLMSAEAVATFERAKEDKDWWDESFFSCKLGYSIGGTMPLPLPAEMRKINGFKPRFNYMVSANYNIHLTRLWGVITGVRLERKGMEAKATVKNYSMSISDDDGGTVSGRWTGDVTMGSDQVAISVPASVACFLSDHWRVHCGAYASYLLNRDFSGEVYSGYLREGDPTGAKIEIDENSQSFNFSNEMRHFQWGVSAGAEWRFYAPFSLSLDLNWGVTDIFKSDFETISFALYPIYGTIGVGYAF